MTSESLVSVKHSQLVLTVSFRCNARCRICLSNCGPARQRILTVDEAIHIIDQAAELDTVVDVGFAGGEVFLPSCYPVMLDTARYIAARFGTPLSASTNAFWAKDRAAATKILEPLVQAGLSTLLVSCDEFHQETIPLERVGIALSVAEEMGVRLTVQTIRRRNSPRAKDYRDRLGLADTDIRWIDNPLTPVGRALTAIPSGDLELRPEIPIGHCTVLRILIIDPNGTVRPCCGAGLVVDRLAVGNIWSEGLAPIIRRIEVDPVLTTLGLWGGPLGLARQLAVLGRPQFVERKYTSACHACSSILSDPEALAMLERFFSENLEAILAHNAWAEDELRLHKIIVQEDDQSGISQSTGYIPPEL